ncbi:hypothetical protein JCM6882_003378 [Rhodosporidiobolus microsporus]
MAASSSTPAVLDAPSHTALDSQERPPPPSSFLPLNEPAASPAAGERPSSPASSWSTTSESSSSGASDPEELKRRFPQLTFSQGEASVFFSYDWDGGLDEAYKLLGLEADQPDLEQRALELAEQELVAASSADDFSSVNPQYCTRLGALLIIACTRAQTDLSPFSTWSIIVRYLYTSEVLGYLEELQLPIPRHSPLSTDESAQHPFFLHPTLIEWTQGSNASGPPQTVAHIITGHPDHGLAVHRPGATQPLKLKLAFDPDELAKKSGIDIAGVVKGDAGAVAMFTRSLKTLPDLLSKGITSFYRRTMMNESFDSASTLAPAISTTKTVSKPTTRKIGTKRAPTVEEKRLLQELVRVKGEATDLKEQLELARMRTQVAEVKVAVAKLEGKREMERFMVKMDKLVEEHAAEEETADGTPSPSRSPTSTADAPTDSSPPRRYCKLNGPPAVVEMKLLRELTQLKGDAAVLKAQVDQLTRVLREREEEVGVLNALLEEAEESGNHATEPPPPTAADSEPPFYTPPSSPALPATVLEKLDHLDALEAENQLLRQENAALQAASTPTSRPPSSRLASRPVDRDYAIRRLKEQLQRLSAQLKVKTEENVELLLRLATKQGVIKQDEDVAGSAFSV